MAVPDLKQSRPRDRKSSKTTLPSTTSETAQQKPTPANENDERDLDQDASGVTSTSTSTSSADTSEPESEQDSPPANRARTAMTTGNADVNEAETLSTSSSGLDSSDDSHPQPKPEPDHSTQTQSQLKKPPMHAADQETIHTRLTSFFSQLAQQRQHGTKEDDEVIERFSSDEDEGYEEGDDGGAQYVEIDLALGVLSEQDANEGGKIRLPARVEEGVEIDGLPKLGLSTEKSERKGKAKRRIEEVG